MQRRLAEVWGTGRRAAAGWRAPARHTRPGKSADARHPRPRGRPGLGPLQGRAGPEHLRRDRHIDAALSRAAKGRREAAEGP